MVNGPRGSLSRLETSFYRGQAYVHWTMTIEGRKTGWLTPLFHGVFREVLTHVAFRYGVTCPVYCLMPDHMHLLWIGINSGSDQLAASIYFRRRLGFHLRKLGCEFQHQGYDRVLKDDDRSETEVENLVDYIARNPERGELVGPEQFASYPFTNCLVPGYPELDFWDSAYWLRFWRCHAYLQKSGLFRYGIEEASRGESGDAEG